MPEVITLRLMETFRGENIEGFDGENISSLWSQPFSPLPISCSQLALMCVVFVSEQLVCCGHPHQHGSDTPAATWLKPNIHPFYLACMPLWVWKHVCLIPPTQPRVFGIATASSLGASHFLLRCISISSLMSLCLALLFSFVTLPLSPSSPSVWRSRIQV